MKEIVTRLTAPLTEEENRAGLMAAKLPLRIAVKGNLAQVQEYFNAHSWTDGLPVIPPTQENVTNMLAGTTHPPDDIVTYAMPPLELAVTVEKVAMNGVMAGCKPADMPVLLAIAEAFSKGSFRSSMISANSFSFMVVVNGPIAKKIGMNSGVNALGPGNQANAAIGRALRLFLTNLGGLTPGITLMACQGNSSNYSFAFAENEEASPWEPLHVSMGYQREESVVTIFSGGWGHGGNMTCLSEEPIDLRGMIEVIRSFQLPAGAAVLLSPPLASQIASEKGFSKQDLQAYLQKNTTKTAQAFRLDPYYGTYIKPVLEGKTYYGMNTVWPPSYLHADPNELVPVYGRSEFIYPIVVGGENYMAFQGWKMALPSTISIDEWR
ncbi:MAG: hypothetical protein A2170_07335 [Deltaproteobacteria bacterium RBG_13_53_10]|nr:MAG: hypothetical protein A2170_07335 [Deltaproteobacteria bacterium RBG_13_53_10]